jgi:UrcA family protein
MKYAITLATCAAFAVAIGGSSVLASPASAKKPVVVTKSLEEIAPTRRVPYGDLNLATRPGVKALYRRVGFAVNSVCEESLGPAAGFYADTSCHSFAWRGARPQIRRAIDRARTMAASGSIGTATATIAITAGD